MPEYPAIAKLRKLMEAATPGPWDSRDNTKGNYEFGVYCDDKTGSIVAQVGGFRYAPRSLEETRANAHLIVEMHNRLPLLLDCAEMFAEMAPREHSPTCNASTLPPEFGGPEDRSCTCGLTAAQMALQRLGEGS